MFVGSQKNSLLFHRDWLTHIPFKAILVVYPRLEVSRGSLANTLRKIRAFEEFMFHF